MSTTEDYFTIQDVDRLKGRRVKLVQRLEGRFLGEAGVIDHALEYGQGYALVIHWDIGFGDGAPREDFLTRREFDHYIREA